MKYLHMDQYIHVKEKLLREVDEHLTFDPWDSNGNYINYDLLLEACSYEKIQEGFDYTMMCFKESLRIEPPVSFTSSLTVTKDVVLARGTAKELKVAAGDEMHI